MSESEGPERHPIQLAACLSAQSWRALRMLARANGFPFDSNWSKADAVARLGPRFAAVARVNTALAALSEEARAALRFLLDRAGQSPQPDFVYRFGALRPYRPWRADAPAAPWQTPSSPTEELFYRALIFPLNLGTHKRPLPAIVLPGEYHATLVEGLPDAPPEAVAPDRPEPQAPKLLSQLAAFLSFLNREAIRPLHGRWLPPFAYHALLPFLGLAAAPTARSELQIPQLVFLHYLLEAAGLVAVTGGLLKPTAAALDWLADSARGRLTVLWCAWTAIGAAPVALWQRYRLPLAREDDPPARFEALCAALAAVLARSQAEAEAIPDLITRLFTHAPHLARPAASYQHWADLDAVTQADYRAQVAADLTALFTGPLAWFGVVAAAADGLKLTGVGAALLGLTEDSWPPEPAAAGLALEMAGALPGAASQDEMRFVLRRVSPPPPDAPGLSPDRRLALEVFAPPAAETPGVCCLSRHSVQHALQRGYSVDRLLALLELGLGALPPVLVGTLIRWAEETEDVTVRQVVVLETHDPALLQELAAQRRVRELLLETFSARVVRVDAARLDDLLRRLARQGIVPQVDVPADVPTPSGAVSAEDRVILAAALQVYATLADALLPRARPPHALARAWKEKLPLVQRDAAEQLATAVLETLGQVAPPEGDYHIPAPTGPRLAILQQAITAGATVEITYYTAGRDATSRRRIDPLRIEWRHAVPYVIAYCHIRRDQRVFRIDRIVHAERVRAHDAGDDKEDAVKA